tara:strand:+ start:15363 stop:17165 length:1803 start_codon:yes stop_codon:yes gene_type:complete
MLIRLFSFLLLIFLSLKLTGQSKRSIKLFQEANNNYNIGEFENAIEIYSKIIKSEPENCNAIYRIGLAYKKLKKYNDYEKYFIKYTKLTCLQNIDQVHFDLSNYFLRDGKIMLSNYHLNEIKSIENFNDFDEIKERISFILNYDEHIVLDFEKIDSIDYFPLQYSPAYSADGKQIYFTSRSGNRIFDDENIYSIYIGEKGFGNKVSSLKVLNTDNNEGSVTFSESGNFLIYTSCKMNFKKNTCDLFISYFDGVKFNLPTRLEDRINSDYWDSQPHLYGDSLLLFVSNRPGGKGNRDIWFSKLGDDGQWEKAKNYDEINSAYDDVSPFVFDNVIYFASNRIESFGGYDIFFSNGSNLKDAYARNLGASINNYKDQTSILINDNFFMISEELMDGSEVISKIILSRIKSRINLGDKLIKFIVKDRISGQPLESSISFTGLEKSNQYHSTITGSLFIDRSFIDSEHLIISAEGYYPEKIKVNNSDSYIINLTKFNQKYILEDLLFDYNSYKLSESVKNSLLLYAQWLKQNDEINIRIEGHTDSVGSDNYNMILSENRANEVLKFLLIEGIQNSRMEAIGFGNKIPFKDNYDGPQNRRIEISIF